MIRDHGGMQEEAEDRATWLARALDARVAKVPCQLHPSQVQACAAWCDEMAPAELPAAQGVVAASIPAEWIDTLAWSGVPLSAEGPLRWGADLVQSDVSCPELRGGVLHLPPPEALAGLTSLSLKPLRMFVAERLGCRLQAAPGIRLWLWPGRAVLLSQSPIPLAGFLYGSAPGHRASVAMEPFGHQIVTW
jgi:hypothetical protein